MNGPLFFSVMMFLLLAFGVAVFWQESRRVSEREVIYGVDDSIEFIWDGLGEEKLGLKISDVRRILEWEMSYLQQPDLWEGGEPPVIGSVCVARYTQEMAYKAGFSYEPEQIFGVMDLQAAYLDAIGAVGEIA